MFSKTAYYASVDEYVKAMTGWKGNDDSGMGGITFIWCIVGILFVVRCLQDSYPEDGSFGGFMLISFALPAALIAGGVYAYKTIMKDREVLEKKHKTVAKVIDTLPADYDCREIDFAFAELIMKGSIDEDTILKLRKLRIACFDPKNRYTVRTRELCGYAKEIDLEREKAGFTTPLQELIGGLEEKIKEEEKKAEIERKKELKVAKKKADRIWEILNEHYEGITKVPELDAEQFLKLEKEYHKYCYQTDFDNVKIGRNYVVKSKLCGFIEYYYRLKMAGNDAKAIKSITKEIARNDIKFKNSLNKRITEEMDDKAIFSILRDVAEYRSYALGCGVVVDALGKKRMHRSTQAYYGRVSSLNDTYSQDDYDSDDGISEYDDGFSNDRFGYDSEAFDFDMDGFDDHFD